MRLLRQKKQTKIANIMNKTCNIAMNYINSEIQFYTNKFDKMYKFV